MFEARETNKTVVSIAADKTAPAPTTKPGVNISGLVVDTDPAATATVAATLAELDGVREFETVRPGKIALVIEAATVGGELGICRTINNLTGVRGVYLCYHHFAETLAADGTWQGHGWRGERKRQPMTWG